MNINKNRTRIMEFLVGLVATQIIVFGLAFYMFNEPTRLLETQSEILAVQVEDAMTLYAGNCVVCHGLAGEGIGATPALNSEALRSMDFRELEKIIARGRYDTSMPAWSKEDGGPLSDYQISEMVALIQSGDWKETQDRVVNLGMAPLVPFTTEPDPVLLAQVGSLPDGPTLQAAIQSFAVTCISCHGADGLGTAIAPALNDPAVRERTVDDLTRTITFGNPGTLMAGWQNALNGVEISSLVTLIQRWEEIPPGILPVPNVPIPVTEESLVLGNQLFSQNCSRCHGPEGQGTQRAPALNVKSFLVDTGDLAIQQIITQGIPGTAMPAWGDRMTEAEIQAIVGFLRQWESTAPEVAIPARGGGGGPPWLRSSTTTTTPSQAAGQGMGQAQGAGQPHSQAATPGWWQAIDWRILLLAVGALSIAFTLMFMGIESLQARSHPTSTADESNPTDLNADD